MSTVSQETAAPAVSFHRTLDGHLAARVNDRSMIALPRSPKGFSVWSAYEIAKAPEHWTQDDFFIVGKFVDSERVFRDHAFELAAHDDELRELSRSQIRYDGHTPWGPAQTSRRYADGIVLHSTAGHDGFDLDEAARAKVHPAWRMTGRFFEEDVDWAIVAFTFPGLFTAHERKAADETLRHWRPDGYEAITGIVLGPGESRVKNERRFKAEHAGDWIVISAIASNHQKGFVECIATIGGDRRKGEQRRYLVPADEYSPRQFGFVIDELRHELYDGPSDFVGHG